MKRQKYGYIYRTHLFGSPTVRVTGAENVRQILLGEHRLVAAQWPASVRTILGSDTLSNVHGAQHKSKKKVGPAPVWSSPVLTGRWVEVLLTDDLYIYAMAHCSLQYTIYPTTRKNSHLGIIDKAITQFDPFIRVRLLLR